MALDLTVNDPGYRNWVKGGLALHHARKGIENFVEKHTDKFHQDLLNSLTAGTNCIANCSTKDIIPCRNNNNFCKIVHRTCKTHGPVDPSKQTKPKCPNSVCDAIRDAIIEAHRFNGPSWKNTDCTRWSREPWQLAKCFMTDGYGSSLSASDTDFPGLLCLVINNKVFNNVVSDDLTSRNNVFCQARQVRNDILHKAVMKLTDKELADSIAILDLMLSDNKTLAAHPDAVDAKIMLNKLLTDTINISCEDERHVRHLRALSEMDQKQQEHLAKIEAATNESVEVVKKKRKLAKDDIQKSIKTIKKESFGAIDSIKAAKEEVITSLTTTSHDPNNIRALKKALVRLYMKKEHLSTSFFPLVQTEDMKIDELYVKPNMQHKSTNVDSYKDLFKHGNQTHENIYVVGDAGLGKTALCQKIVSTWCRVQNDTTENVSDDQTENVLDDQQAMAEFDFVFYISLREAVTDNDVEEMIKHQLLNEKYHKEVSAVLKNEKCLIILDGLDEWVRENAEAKSFCNKGIPGRNDSENVTILTTTRPWKLDAIQLKRSQIDAQIKLLGIAESSYRMLIQRMLTHLNKEENVNKTMEDFISELTEKHIQSFMTIPVILKQLICLWHRGKEIGQTKTEIYWQMMELLLDLAQIRLRSDPKYKNIKDEWVNSPIQLPSCFVGNNTCEEFKQLLFVLSKLAFETILRKDKDSALVFKQSQAQKIHGMT